MMRICGIILAVSLLLIPVDLYSQDTSVRVLSLEDAKRIANAAEARAMEDNWTVVITIIDAGGHPILLHRVDDTQIGSIGIALQKAKTAVFYKRPTKAFQDGVAAGNTGILNLPDLLPFEGGLPIMYDGAVIGGIGVSGVTAAQDGIIAQAGIDAL
ncbi:heme-binding protein [Rhodohalobacter sp. SW132]|uniref:GlcG/HbpS family heme-binding protein n=1 Tax=Rhodohalobacter sp. SW132 TaxID=2293433 RepID=UPI000E238DA1|nr:heme-binding protein [Rhodohalobacter sp. SW132]REL24528.1 heme-binding protein [Rhodohalobacter sp. SW132]